MKKKFLLMVMSVLLFALFLALGASATTIYRDADGNQLFSFEFNKSNVIESYTGEFPKTDSEGNALTWYVTSTTTEGGNTIKTVASILTLDQNHTSLDKGVFKFTGNTVTNLNVVSVNFPSDKGITKISLNNGGFRLSNTYTYSPSVSEILFVYLPSTLTELP